MLDDDAVLLRIVGERSQFLMPVPEFGCIAVRPVPFMMEKAVRIVEDVGDSVLHLAVAVVINGVAVRVEHILAGAVAIRFIQHAVAVWPRAGMVGHEIDNYLDPVVMKRINQRREVLHFSEMRVGDEVIPRMIAMIGRIHAGDQVLPVLVRSGDPYGRNAHIFEVRDFLLNAFPIAALIFVQIGSVAAVLE